MASPAVVEAVEARLAANWNLCPIRGLNDDGTGAPIDGGPFLQVQYPVADEEQISIGSPGSNVFRETGAFRFIFNVPTGSEVLPWLYHVDTLRSLFRAKKFGVVNTWAPSSSVLNDDNDNGNYFKLSFAVPYYADILA